MRVLVCGSRDWANYSAIRNRLAVFAPCVVIVHGGARGADELAGRAATELGLEQDVFLPDWERYGRRAGYLRNRQMIDSGVELVIAFWRNRSTGTGHTIDLAQRCGIPVEVREWPN